MKKLKGSLTVFFALVMVSIMALLFSLTELLRYKTLTEQADQIAILAAENFMANYQRELFSTYGILGRDTGHGRTEQSFPILCNEIMADLSANGNPAEKGISLIRISPQSCEIVNYGFYTDNGGDAFIKAGAERVLGELPEIIIDSLQSDADIAKDAFENGVDTGRLLSEGGNGMSRADSLRAEIEQAEKDGDGSGPSRPAKTAEVIAAEAKYAGVENPITTVSSVNSNLLGLVVPKGMTVSDKAIDLSQVPSHRAIYYGGGRSPSIHAGVTDVLLFQQYVLTDLQHFGKDMSQPGLKYASEYVLCGKASDRDNLKAVAERLLLFREIQNMTALMNDGAKVAEAYTFALALVGWTAVPAIIDAVKYGILAAWATVESVLDIRTLLSGEKVPILKNPAEWTSSLMNLGSLLRGEAKAVSSGNGISYEGYLRMFLAMVSKKDLAFRTMDIEESAIRTMPEYASLRMENVLYAGDIEMTMVGSPLFLSFIPNGDSVGAYTFERERVVDYL